MTLIRIGDPFLARYSLRQRKRARLYCAEGHDMEERFSIHLGRWRSCSRCGLIEEQ